MTPAQDQRRREWWMTHNSIAHAARDNPDMTNKQIAKLLGLDDSMVQRHLLKEQEHPKSYQFKRRL